MAGESDRYILDTGLGYFEHREVQRAIERDRVIRQATVIIDAIRGVLPGVRSISLDSLKGHSGAPVEVPHFSRNERFANESFASVTGDLGDFVSRHPYLGDERPSHVANTCFYAGVLAAKLGLVTVEDFRLYEPDTNES